MASIKKPWYKKVKIILGLLVMLISIAIGIKTLFSNETKESPSINQNNINQNKIGDNNTIISGSGNTINLNPPTNSKKNNQKVEPENPTTISRKDYSSIEEGYDSITKIAILPFENISNEAKFSWLSRGIPESLINPLSEINKYAIIEGNQRDKVLSEIDFEQGKYVDPKTAVKIGRLLGSQQVMIGSYQVYSDSIQINSRIVSVETGKVEKASIAQYTGSIKNLLQVEKSFALQLSQILGKSSK